MKKIILPILILLSIHLNGQNASIGQSVISSSGETFQSNDYILNFTIGEVIIGTFDTNNLILSQGFHQPDSTDIISSTIFKEFGEELNVYPIPSFDKIYADFSLQNQETVTISIYDILGKLLQSSIHQVHYSTIDLDVSQFLPGQYIIEFTNSENQKKQIYKIIKQ